MIAALYFTMYIIILLSYDHCYGRKMYFIWFIRNSWGKLPFIYKSLLIVCKGYQSKAEASKWWSWKLYTLVSVLCFVYQREKNSLQFKNHNENREQGVHHYTILAPVFMNRMHIIWKITHIKKLNSLSMNDPAFEKFLLCV